MQNAFDLAGGKPHCLTRNLKAFSRRSTMNTYLESTPSATGNKPGSCRNNNNELTQIVDKATDTHHNCLNRHGKPRHSYANKQSAEEGADYALKKYGKRMVPYRCNRCGSWHLSPIERHTPSHYCYECSKQAYSSESSAERRASILFREERVLLRVYECPYGEGWHLTSRS